MGVNQSNIGVVPEGYSLPPGQQAFNTLNYYVSDGYFATQGVRILRGRGFSETDQAEAPLVAVVNTQFAEHYLAPAGRARETISSAMMQQARWSRSWALPKLENTSGFRSRRSTSSTCRTCNIDLRL